MAILLYCVAETNVSLHAPSGVPNSPVSRLDHSALAIFYSENESSDAWLRAPLSSSATEFHRVQEELFRAGPIIPFRFPTILDNKDELQKHLEERSETYEGLLHRFADCVQMDISLAHTTAASTPASGAAYLRERQSRTRTLEDFAKNLRAVLLPLITDWRERSVKNGLRCFALVARKQVQEFNERLKAVSVPRDITARVSGPWPVAEFLDFKI